MPEIKRNFAGGKMNKDVDERLVPNGQYRNAMNIQVSTSEGSDVGAAQNILGNTKIDGFTIEELKEHCVASIADEKNDVGYYFIAGGENYTPQDWLAAGESPAWGTYPEHNSALLDFERDMIIKFDGTSTTPVFVDPFLKTAICSKNIYNSNAGTILLNAGTNPFSIEAGDIITRIETSADVYDDLNIPILVATTKLLINESDVPNQSLWSHIINSAINGLQFRVVVNRRDSRVLKFDVVEDELRSVGKLITGINIIDNMLFWTDGFTEPKKINIDRSTQGTLDSFKRTKLVVNDTLTSHACEEENVTVIKKGPNKAPTISSLNIFRGGIIYSKSEGTNTFGDGAGAAFPIGTTAFVAIEDVNAQPVSFVVGDVLRFSSDQNTLPPENHQVRASVISGPHAGPLSPPFPSSGPLLGTTLAGETGYGVEILTMSSSGLLAAASSAPTTWYVGLEQIGKSLFEQKLPRFSCRYKYEDNEYSAPGPFSEVVFIPGDFKYHPQEAYNTGMVNFLKDLTLQDFIPTDMPKDVVQVDLLYKNETNPNIYTIENVTKEDTLISGVNAWTSPGSQDGLFGSYKVSTENIYATLPSNQLLRTWDNVPRTALSQAISGNRIIYGNYLQNYNLKGDNSIEKLVPNIQTTITSRKNRVNNIGMKSIKSLRSYDLGVVWGDQYGRETPIITPSSGSTSVPKSSASNSNAFGVELDGNHPDWSDYYKIFIKETSNEYYNLAMDRLYDAKDGNVWISFPSVDRNKVDEDTYLILKKGIDNDFVVEDEARYKIVAIENEAPEFIKTSYEILTESNTDITQIEYSSLLWGGDQPSSTASSGLPDGGRNAPSPGQKGFSINSKLWTSPWRGATGTNQGLALLDELFDKTISDGLKEMYVSFSREDEANSIFHNTKKYKVISILLDEAEDGDGPMDEDSFYDINIDEQILSLDEPISSGVEDVLSGDFVRVHFWERKVENKPEFDGRFFVKILKDDIIADNLVNKLDVEDNWSTSAQTIFYKIEDTSLSYHDGAYSLYQPIGNFQPYATSGNAPQTNNSTLSNTKTEEHWNQRLKFGGTTTNESWFIDKASFASYQPAGSTANYKDAITKLGGLLNATVESADTTSNQTFGYEFKHIIFQNWADTIYLPSPWPAYHSGSPEDLGDGLSTGVIGMRGAHTDNNKHYLTLSYSKIGPDLPSQSNTSQLTSAEQQPNFTVGEDSTSLTNTTTEQEEAIVSSLKPEQRFRIKNNPVIYKIIAVNKNRLYNFRGAHTSPWRHTGTIIPGQPGSWGTIYSKDYIPQHLEMGKGTNRRAAYRINYEVDWSSAPNPILVYDSNGDLDISQMMLNNPEWAGSQTSIESLEDNAEFNLVNNNSNPAASATILFIDQFESNVPNTISRNPAIFETEPKEDTDLDIYYEATNRIPTKLTKENQELFIPIGATLEFDASIASDFPAGIFVTSWEDPIINAPNTLILSQMLTLTQFQAIVALPKIKFVRDDGSFTSVTSQAGPIVNVNGVNMIYALTVEISNKIGLGWFNCWSFNNGVESNRIGDTYNKPFITNGVKVSSVIVGDYKEENRINGLIYSGIYNSNSNTNELNQFIAAEKITKDINPIYGSIQKLHSRDGDLVTLCEDKCLRILVSKDALYNADGNPQLLAKEGVLGQAIPFVGEFGISKNPESFASESYRVYFTDRVRGTVMRLSRDGLTPISMHGMKDWFRDNLRLSTELIGSYDDRKDEYNITIKKPDYTQSGIIFNDSTTVSFKEDAKGWVSFKSFIPENAISCANQYYTFLNGELWKHHTEQFDGFGKEINRNTFYNVPKESSLSVILNDLPGSVKSFHTLNYEGSQSKVNKFIEYNTFGDSGVIVTGTLSDKEYYNLDDKQGWHVENIETNKQKGAVNEFIEKEGKWFNHIKGQEVVSNNFGNITSGFDTANFAIQGIGMAQAAVVSTVLGCTDTTAFNYDPLADFDDGSCVPIIHGCTDPLASNTNTSANTPDGSCLYHGCTEPAAWNYNANANYDDGSCIGSVEGCTDPTMFNYDPLANTLGTCVPFIYGCTDNWTADGCGIGCNGAVNYNSLANTACDQLGTGLGTNDCCRYEILGCTDRDGALYDPLATVDDDSCLFCGDPTANNYDNAVTAANLPFYDGCEWCVQTTNLHAINITTTGVDLIWDTPTTSQPQAAGDYYLTITETTGGAIVFQGNITPIASGAYQSYATINSVTLAAGTDYTFEVGLQCSNSNGITDTFSVSTLDIPGCMDNTGAGNTIGSWGACNYDPLATSDDGTCEYASCAGCTNPVALNYDPLVIFDDGSCILPIPGCMDSTMFNYNPAANVDDGSCIPFIYGCTNDQLDNNGIYNNVPTSYAANNYNPLANTPCDAAGTGPGSNECCDYNCPILFQQQGFSSGTFVQNTVNLNVNLLNTFYSLGISGGGDPDDYKIYVSVQDASGAIIYDNGGNELSGVIVNGLGYHLKKLTFAVMDVPVGETAIFVEWVVETNDGSCDQDGPAVTYTIGCTDTNANNAGSFAFTDNTQCTYTGCTDDTLDNNGNYAAVGAFPYSVNNTTACNNGGGDNDCCTYNETPTAIFIPQDLISGTTDYSSLETLEYDFNGTAYHSAAITSFKVTTPDNLSTTWLPEYIGGAWLNADLYTDHITNSATNLTLSPNYNTGQADSSAIPSNFDNIDLTTFKVPAASTTNALAHSPLEIEFTVEWNATLLNNASLGNSITTTITYTQSFTGGCKIGSNIYSNWDNTLDLHIPGSCILIPVLGCTDSTAINYNSLANTDDGSCCLSCDDVSTLTASNPTMSGSYATHMLLNFTEVCEATVYSIDMKIGSGSWSNINLLSATNPNLVNGEYTVFLLTPQSSGTELSFRIGTECTDGSTSSYSNTASTTIP